MSLYVDSSAVLKVLLRERESASCEAVMSANSHWITARHTEIEVRRNVARALRGIARSEAKDAFGSMWGRFDVVELLPAVCSLAASLAEETGVKTLDALHLAAAYEAAEGGLSFLTYDAVQGRAARAFGWNVLGA